MVETEPEIVEGELVELRAYELDRPRWVAPAVQAAAAAATGFLVGAATLALAQRLGAKRLDPARLPLLEGSATYVVYVRSVGRPPQ